MEFCIVQHVKFAYLATVIWEGLFIRQSIQLEPRTQ